MKKYGRHSRRFKQYSLSEAFIEQGLINVDGIRIRTYRDSVADDVVRAVDTMANIVSSKDRLFRVEEARGRRWFRESTVGRDFRMCLKAGAYEARRHFPGHRFHPLFELFEKHADGLAYTAGRPLVIDVDPLNAVVDAIRNDAKISGFDRRIKKELKTMLKNRRGLLADLRELRRRHSRLLGIRIDVGYGSIHGPGGFIGDQISYDQVKQDRAKLFRHLLRGPFKKSFLWYAWKQESAFEKGPHTHLLIIFDGRKLRNDTAVAYLLGRHWTEVITQGKGTAFNCNANKQRRYQRVAIGQLRRDDDRTYDALFEVVVTYMSKPDEYFRFDAPGRNRAFGRSSLPKSAKPAGGKVSGGSSLP